MTPTFIILASCVAFATLVVILLIALICNKVCRTKAQRAQQGYLPANATTAADNTAIDLDRLPVNANYHNASAQLNPKLEKLEYPRNDIIYMRYSRTLTYANEVMTHIALFKQCEIHVKSLTRTICYKLILSLVPQRRGSRCVRSCFPSQSSQPC